MSPGAASSQPQDCLRGRESPPRRRFPPGWRRVRPPLPGERRAARGPLARRGAGQGASRRARSPPRDRALARLIAGTVLRRLGELEAVLSSFLEKPLPERQGNLWPILLVGAAQLLFLATPPHAAVGLAVEQARRDRFARRYDRLVNALLRRLAREGASVLRRPRRRAARHSRLALRAMEQDLRRGRARAASPKPRSARRRSTSPSRAEPEAVGAAPRRHRAADRHGAARGRRPHRGSGRLRGGRLVGAGRGRSLAGAAARIPSPDLTSPICARRPAARRPSSPRPAPIVTAVDLSEARA